MVGSELPYFARHNLEWRLLGRKTPVLCGFKITHRCNLRCKACPFWKQDSQELTFPEVKRVLSLLHQKEIRLLIFEGGEPFLWRDGNLRLGAITNGLRVFGLS